MDNCFTFSSWSLSSSLFPSLLSFFFISFLHQKIQKIQSLSQLLGDRGEQSAETETVEKSSSDARLVKWGRDKGTPGSWSETYLELDSLGGMACFSVGSESQCSSVVQLSSNLRCVLRLQEDMPISVGSWLLVTLSCTFRNSIAVWISWLLLG